MGLVKWASDAVRNAIRDRATSLLDNIGATIAEEARRLCPVDTGQLKASIGYIVRPSDMTVQVYADKSYAIFVEYGTSRMAAQPFLRPAIAAGKRPSKVTVAIGLPQHRDTPPDAPAGVMAMPKPARKYRAA